MPSLNNYFDIKKAFKIMHEVWDSQNAGGNLETELWPIPHSCGVDAQQRVLEFYERRLKKK